MPFLFNIILVVIHSVQSLGTKITGLIISINLIEVAKTQTGGGGGERAVICGLLALQQIVFGALV